MVVTSKVYKSFNPDHQTSSIFFLFIFSFNITSILPSCLQNICPALMVFFLKEFLQDSFISPQQHNVTLKHPELMSSDPSCLHSPSDGDALSASCTRCSRSTQQPVSGWKGASFWNWRSSKRHEK